MPALTLAMLAKSLTPAEIERLIAMKRAGPKLEKLEAKRDEIVKRLADVEREISELSGGEAPKTRRGSKPHPAKAAPAKRTSVKIAKKTRRSSANDGTRLADAVAAVVRAKAGAKGMDMAQIIDALAERGVQSNASFPSLRKMILNIVSNDQKTY